MRNKLLLPLTAIAYIVAFFCIQTVAQLIVLLVEKLIFHKPLFDIDAVGMIIAMGIFSIVAVALFVWQKWAPLSKAFIQSRPWSVMFWSFIASLGAIIPSVYLQEQMPAWPDSIQQQIDQLAQMMLEMMNTPGGYVVICLLAPIAEEVVFRGAVLRKLLEWKPEHRWLMIILSALLFALSHMNPAQFVHPLLIGILLGWMYERTGSIIPGIIYHWCNNTVAYLMSRLYQDSDITVTQILGSQSRALMAVGFSLLIFIPALYQLNVWMKKR